LLFNEQLEVFSAHQEVGFDSKKADFSDNCGFRMLRGNGSVTALS